MTQLGVFLGAFAAATEGDSNLLKQSAILVTSDTSSKVLLSLVRSMGIQAHRSAATPASRPRA